MKRLLKYEHKQIIEHFYLADQEYISSQELAHVVGLSSPTIIGLLNELDSDLKIFGAEFEARPGYGYKLVINDDELFQSFIHSSFYMDSIRVNDNQDIIHYIIRAFLSKQYVRSAYFETKLYLGRRTIFNLYKEVSANIKVFNLDLTSASTNGNTIEGSEHNIRSCINYETVFCQNSNLNINEKFQNLYINNSKSQEIEKIIIKHQIAYNKNSLDDNSIRFLASALYIAHVRNQMGQYLIYDDDVIDRFVKRDSYYMAKSIVDTLKHELQLVMSDQESLFTAIYIVANRCFVHKEDFPRSEGYIDCMNLSIELVKYLKEINNFKYLDKDSHIIDALSINLTQIVTQSEFNLYRPSDGIKSSKSLQATLMAVQCAKFIENRYQFQITPTQVDYLATIIYPVFGRYPFVTHKGRAIVISNINKFVAVGMVERLERNFGNQIRSFDVMNLYELDSAQLEAYDFLFTSYPSYKLPKLPGNLTVIHLNTFFNIDEKAVIRNVLINKTVRQGLNYMSTIQNVEIVSNIEAVSKEEVFDCVSKYNNCKTLKDNFLAYEKYIDYTIVHNVVFITPLESTASQPKVQVFLLNKNINWGISKVRVVIYWDKGNVLKYSSYCENESFPQVVYQLFSRNEVIDALLRKESGVEELIQKIASEINDSILETGASFR